MYAGKHRVGATEVAEGEILCKGMTIEFSRYGKGQDCFNFRSKQKNAAIPAVIEGLDAKSIAGGEQNPLSPVPDHECEHAVEMGDALATIFLIGMHDRLSVTAGAISMSLGFKLGAQPGVVIDFPIEHNRDVLGFVGQWLMPGLNVDDAQAAHRESDVSVDEEAFIVGTAVRNALGHRCQRLALNATGFIREEDAANSAHLC